MRDFWDADIRLVSPGALGMYFRIAIFSDEEAKEIASAFGYRYDAKDKWIILDKRP